MISFFECKHCKNIALKLVDQGPPLSCCGDPMIELKAGTSDGAHEKHVPALQINGDILSVQVGEVLHPMTPEHFIQWILVEQGDKIQYQRLTPDQEPKASFKIEPGVPFTVYEHCNLHGLWKIEQ